MPAPTPRRAIRWLAALIVLPAVLSLGACGDSDGSDDASVSVVTTTTVLTDFARVVAGSRLEDGTVSVVGLLRPGVDPHDFEPSVADTLAVARADVILINGAGFEGFLQKLIESAEPSVEVTDTSEDADLRPGDPHLWHDPRNAAVMVGHVADALVAADPEGSDVYRANEAAYLEELTALDQEIGEELSTLSHRGLVTNHDALGYYADRYGLDVIGAVIPSFDSAAEMSAADVDALVSAIRATGAPAVFAEASLPPAAARAVAEEAGVIEHMKAICNAVGLGVIYYARDNTKLSPAGLEKLAEACPNFIGYKDGIGDLQLMQRVHYRLGDRLVHIGGLPTAEVFAQPYLEMGVTTYSSAVFNFVPELALRFYKAVRQRDAATIDALMKSFYLPLIDLRDKKKGYAVSMIKAGAEIVGRSAGKVRSPLTELDAAERDVLRGLIEAHV